MSTNSPWTRRISGLSFWLAFGAIAIAFVGMTLARYDNLDKLTGFQAFLYMVPVAGLAAVIGIVALIMNWRTGWPAVRKAALGVVIGGLAFGAATVTMSAAGDYPYIHDITTDLENPPEFATLAIPEDNLRGVETVAKWKELHAEGYADLDGIVVEGSVAATILNAQALAEDRGWTVESVQAEEGRLEAVSYESWIKFEDIVVLRVVPTEDGQSRVDMRSVSRVGVSDLGKNAQRIEEFLAALQAS